MVATLWNITSNLNPVGNLGNLRLLEFFVLREGDHVLHKCFGRGVKVSWSPMTWFSYKKSRKPRAPPTYIPYYLYNTRGGQQDYVIMG